jgi:hypothetical protein
MTKYTKPDPYAKIQSDRSLDELLTHSDIERDATVNTSLASEEHSEKSSIELSDAELIRRFRTSLINNILPTVPSIRGYHLCWVPAQSNNTFDTIQHRQRLGYEVVKPEEMPNYNLNSNRAASVDGCIAYNELVLMKLPLRLYELYMTDLHHEQPIEQERIIKQSISERFVDDEGRSLVRDQEEMTGISSLARKVKKPTFI